MASLSDFQLYWSGERSPSPDMGAPCQQYVFETHADEKFSLRRVRSVQDAMSHLSGSRRSADWFAVAATALLYGNLVATGQWFLLLGFAMAGLLTAVLELRAAAAFSMVVLAALLLETVRRGPSLHWLALEGIQMLLALALLIGILHLSQEDPRSYVLLRDKEAEEELEDEEEQQQQRRASAPEAAEEQASLPGQLSDASSGGVSVGHASGDGGARLRSAGLPGSQDGAAAASAGVAGRVTIRNRCCMDVKLLVFDGDDFVRLVPHGGLLGGTLLARGASCCVGHSPPYVVKAYAPWEIELGIYLVGAGTYSLQATAPPLMLLPSGEQRFTNDTEDPVRVSICRTDFWWCSSLWMPLTPQIARLVRGTTVVPPEADLELGGPCTLRVYDAHVLTGFLQRACCRVRAGERAVYLGSFRWTPTRGGVSKSCSSIFNAVS